MSDPGRILLIHLAGVGDLIMGLPAINALAQTYPKAQIDLVVLNRNRDLARSLKPIRQVFVFEESKSLATAKKNLSQLNELGHRNYDWAVNMYSIYRWLGGVKIDAFMRAAQPQKRYGRIGAGAHFDGGPEESDLMGLHEVERQLALMEFLGADRGLLDKGIKTAEELLELDSQPPVDELLARLGLNGPLSLMHAGGTKHHRLPEKSYIKILERLNQEFGLTIGLIGSAGERDWCRQLADAVPGVVDLSGKTILPETAVLMRSAPIVIANDSGPMHLAALMQAPLVALMGPGDPRRFGPFPLDRARQVVICSAESPECYDYDCAGHEEFRRLSADRIVDTAAGVLKNADQPGFQVWDTNS